MIKKNERINVDDQDSYSDSLDFQDLNIDKQAPIVEKKLQEIQSEDNHDQNSLLQISQAKDNKTINIQNSQTISELNNQLKLITENLNSYIEKNKILEQKNRIFLEQNIVLKDKIKQSGEQIKQLSKKIINITDQYSKISLQNNIMKDIIIQLEKQTNIQSIKTNQFNQHSWQLQSAFEQLEYYKKSQEDIRMFLEKECSVLIKNDKTLKSIIENYICELHKNRMDLATELDQICLLFSQKSHIENDYQYNHWKQMRKIQQIEQYCVHLKQQNQHLQKQILLLSASKTKQSQNESPQQIKISNDYMIIY